MTELEHLESELRLELARRDAIRERQMARYVNRTATRARTTTSNARADWVNERIEALRGQIRAIELGGNR